MKRIGFIGAGKVGRALAVLLSSKGYQIAAVSSRTIASARNLSRSVNGCPASTNNQDVADAADLVFITTPDGVIGQVATQISWRPGQTVVHCSGADSTDILEPARKADATVGGFHPLQTFAGLKQAIENMPGSTFALEAEEPLLGTLKDMATAIGARWIELKAADKAAYHTAAVFACNYLVTLVKLASDLWQTFSVPPAEATRAMLPLLRGTLNNIDAIGIPGCLTGPIARGDAGTVQKHLNTLETVAPSLLSTYKELGLQTIPVALAKGTIDEKQAQELRSMLSRN